MGSIVAQRIPARVLMTADTVGGVWTYAIELSRALGNHGVEVGLATMGAHLTPTQRAEAGALANVKVFESAYKLEWMDEARADVERAGHWLLGIESQFRPDVVHLNGYSHGACPWQAPAVVVGHSCVLSWWRAVHGTDAPAEWNEYREAVMAGLHGADIVVAPSRSMLGALEENYGPFKASAVVWNGRALPNLRRRGKHDFILAAGRLWDAAKNLSALAEVAPRLKWPIYLAGEESAPDGRCAGFKNVCCLGHLAPSDMLQWFERASIYAFPARYEPFGLSILEAALAGCALVLGDIPSLREIWGDAAMFVPPDDLSALESVLRRLISNRAEIARLSAAAGTVAGLLTPERMAAGCLAVYDQVLQKHPQLQHKEHLYANRDVLSHPLV